MDVKSILIDNQTIALYQKGSGDTVLFFVQGNSSSAELFGRQFYSNLADKFRLVAVDLPGHGHSAYANDPEQTYTIGGFGEIISGVADYLKLENVIYIGHSLGGHIILQSWDKFSSLKGLVVFGSTPFGVPPVLDKAFYPHPALNNFFTTGFSEEVVEIWAASLLKPGSRIPDFIPGNIRNTDPLVRKIVGESIPKGLIRDELKLAEELKVPLAILHGEDDQLINSEYLEELSIAMLWRNKIHYIPDAGHSPQWENADKFNALIEEYAREVLD